MSTIDYTAKLDRVLAENAVTRGQLAILTRQGERIMSTQDDIIVALKAGSDANARARTTIQALETENADLKAKLTAATKRADAAVDVAAVQAAISDATGAAQALTDIIPTGADRVIAGGTTVTVADSQADAAAVSAADTATGDAAGQPDTSKNALGAVPATKR